MTVRSVCSRVNINPGNCVSLKDVVKHKQYLFTVTERRITNGTVIRRNLIIKCPTPLVLEDLVKDMASKVDLIYDKLAVDNTSGEEEKKEGTVDEIEDIDHNYSLEMYQNDNAEEIKKIKDVLKFSKINMKNRSSRISKDIHKNHRKNKSRVARHGDKLLKKDINTKLEVLNQKIEKLSTHFEGIEQNEGLKNNVNKVKKIIAINVIEGVIILNGSENILKLIEEKMTMMHSDLRCGFEYFLKKFKSTDGVDLNPFVNDCWSVNATEKSCCKLSCVGLDKVVEKTANKDDIDSGQNDGKKLEGETHFVDVRGSEGTKDHSESF